MRSLASLDWTSVSAGNCSKCERKKIEQAVEEMTDTMTSISTVAIVGTAFGSSPAMIGFMMLLRHTLPWFLTEEA